jgi:polysaccharide export outer membrane protein
MPLLIRASLLGLVFTLLAACASGGGGGGAHAVPEGGFGTATDVRIPSGSVNQRIGNPADYKIGPQDLLEISVFQVADLSKTVRVNTSGDISLPLVGVVHAGGLSVQEVEASIARKLTDSYLQNPQVSVFVKEFSSQRVTLEGSIAKPGIYPLTGETTLLQTVAMAGGLGEMADPTGILVFRMIDGRKKVARFDLKQIRQGNAEDPVIRSDDIVVVSESGTKSMFSQLLKTMPVLGLFTFF